MAPHADHLHALGQQLLDGVYALADHSGFVDRDLGVAHAHRRRRDLGLEHVREEVDREDRADHAERVRDAVADRRFLVTGRRERRLQRRGRRTRAGEQSRGGGNRQPKQFAGVERHRQRCEHADERKQVPHEPRPREPGEELPAVLDADPVQEQEESDRADHAGRRRLRRERADHEPGEEHRADAEREPLDRNLAQKVARADGEE